MKRVRLVVALCALSLLGLFACAKNCQKETVPQIGVYFVQPHDGDTVSPTFTIKFGVNGMTVRPAGEDVNDKTSGHHHLLVDDPKGYVDAGQVVPADATHIHFGKGQTETTVTLMPGTHKLSLQFADGAHLSYGPSMSQSITVTVGTPTPQ